MSPPESSPSDGVTSPSEVLIVTQEQRGARRHGSWTLQFRYGEKDIDGRRSACSCGARGDWRDDAGQCAVDQAEHMLKAARQDWRPPEVAPDVAAVEPHTWTALFDEVWVQPGHRPDVPYEGWSGQSNYVTPFPRGTRLQIERGASLRFGDVTRTRGYGPDVVEMDGEAHGTDLTGAFVTVLRAACLGLPEVRGWPGCEAHHHPLCPLDDLRQDEDVRTLLVAPPAAPPLDPPGTCHLHGCPGKGIHEPHGIGTPTPASFAAQQACPGPHRPAQHRDGKPPWCRVCGCGADGRDWRDKESPLVRRAGGVR